MLLLLSITLASLFFITCYKKSFILLHPQVKSRLRNKLPIFNLLDHGTTLNSKKMFIVRELIIQ